MLVAFIRSFMKIQNSDIQRLRYRLKLAYVRLGVATMISLLSLTGLINYSGFLSAFMFSLIAFLGVGYIAYINKV